MINKPDTGTPSAGPFTVVWLGIDAAPGAEWQRYERTVPTEALAVRLWRNCVMYANTHPVSISPEPEWTRHTYNG